MLNKQANQLILSADGSHTIHSGQFDTSYHSKHGAIQESQHVFIESGLIHWQNLNPGKKSIRIFEMGMGTGLNILMTTQYAAVHNLDIHFTTVEKFPINNTISDQLNYSEELGTEPSILKHIHNSEWSTDIPLSENFTLHKLQNDLINIDLDNTVDIVFYDAFGPKSQPELWDLTATNKIVSLMHDNAIFVTYCAQGAFRRNLKSSGLDVSKIPGPPGKREMIRAIKSYKSN